MGPHAGADLHRPSAPPPHVRAAIDDFADLFRGWRDVGRLAISVGGSIGKGTADERSDLDLRLFHEHDLPWPDRDPERWRPYFERVERWRQRGVTVDGVWPRRIDAVDAAVRRAAGGDLTTEPLVWTVWGYHLLADVSNQYVVDDPEGVIEAWRRLLTPYPPALKQAVLRKHLGSLRYWRADYHYRNKVARGDAVFLASLAARLVHDVMQVLFAINETYYVGDGSNLTVAGRFRVVPQDLARRVSAALYPGEPGDPGAFERQRQTLIELIDDVETLATAATGSASA